MSDNFQTFRDLLRKPDDPSFLFEAALQITLLVEEPVTPGWRENARDTVRGFARRFRESPAFLQANDSRVLLEMFCDYFSRDLTFGGDMESYHDPANSSLLHVIEHRRGLPITLSILLVEMARQVEIPMWGIAAPRHFVVGSRIGGTEFVIDPFNACRLTPREEYLEQLADELGVDPRLLLAACTPASDKSILKRMLKNLMVSFSQQGDTTRIVETLQWAIELDPNDPEDLLNRGILRLRMRRLAEGATDLLRVLELTPESHPNRDHIHREALEALEQAKKNQ